MVYDIIDPSIEDRPNIIYTGVGSEHRAYDAHKKNRKLNRRLKELLGNYELRDLVFIRERDLTKKEARAMEKVMIKTRIIDGHPLLNVHHTVI